MNTIKAIWAWIMGLFGGKPKRPTGKLEVSHDSGETYSEVPVPTEGDIKKAAQTPDDYVTQEDAELQAKVDTITAHAEQYEMDQEAMMAEYGRDKDLFVEAAYLVDWTEVVKAYADKTIIRIMGSGTNFNIRGRDDLKRYVTQAVEAESATRTPDAPATNGMMQ